MKSNILLRVVNRILKPLRFRLYPITAGQLLQESLTRKKFVKFIQIGANDGVRFDGLYGIVTARNWTGLLIEPIHKHFTNLARNYSNYKNVLPLNIGIHPTLKNVSIYSVKDKALSKYPIWIDGCNSFNKDHLTKNGVLDADIDESSVKCDSLMSFVEQFNMYDIDYLQVDTEGFDAEILKLIDFKRLKPSVIKFEWMNLLVHEQNEIRNILLSQGYKLEIDQDGSDCCAWLANSISI
jgi:FkbM family methyltransferase